MKGFAGIDYVVVVGYLMINALIGSSFYRRKTTPKDYFLGGRSMRWLPVGISIIAADMSAISVMGLPAWSYEHNLQLLWMSVGGPLMLPVVIFVFVPFYATLNLYTAYEYLERRFSVSVRLVGSILFQLLRGTHVVIALYAPSLVISFVTGLPVWECIFFMGAVTTLYTALGGMKAVIWTDVIQFCMVTSGILVVFFMAVGQVDGGIVTAYKTALGAGRLKLLDFSLDPKHLTSFWACLIGGSFISLAPLTTDQAILQRLFTTKSIQDCQKSVILQAILVIPINLLLYLVGTALFVFYDHNPSHLAGLGTTDAIMPFFAMRELPRGVSGMVIASIIAASMAVMSAGLHALTTATTVDIYQRVIRTDDSPGAYAAVGRIGTLGWGLAVTVFALFANRLVPLALAYNRVSSYISGPLLGIFLLGVLSKRATAGGSLIGALLGLGAVGITSLSTEWGFFYLGPIGVAGTFFGGYLASLFMPPPSPNKLRGLVMGGRPAVPVAPE